MLIFAYVDWLLANSIYKSFVVITLLPINVTLPWTFKLPTIVALPETLKLAFVNKLPVELTSPAVKTFPPVILPVVEILDVNTCK